MDSLASGSSFGSVGESFGSRNPNGRNDSMRLTARVKAICVSPDQSIKEVLIQISEAVVKEKSPSGLALVIDSVGQLLGVATDGDFRRSWAKGLSADSPISAVMVEKPIVVKDGLTDSEILASVTEQVRKSGRIRDFKVDHVIVVDESHRVVDVRPFFEIWQGLDPRSKSVCVVGMGFVGLTLGVVLADVGYEVSGFDTNASTVGRINEGLPGFYERGLEPLLKSQVEAGRIAAFHQIEASRSDIYLVSVGTPIGPDSKPDLTQLEAAVKAIGIVLTKGNVVILRSTVPVGTTRGVVIPWLEKASGLQAGKDFGVCFAPERTVEGNALEELRRLPQVIGATDSKTLNAVAEFFSKVTTSVVRLESLEAAEMVKLVNNSFRDLSFAFSNELARVCFDWDLDAVKIIKAANEGYPRNPVPMPSPGVGGICLKKDPYLYSYSQNQAAGIQRETLSQLGRKTNESMPGFLAQRVVNFLAGKQTGPAQSTFKVFLVGFAFKGEPETSDYRNSTSLDIYEELKKRGEGIQLKIYGYDPVIDSADLEKIGIAFAEVEKGFENADAVLILNNHRSYLDFPLHHLLPKMKKQALFLDTWGLFTPDEIERQEGLVYSGLSGRH